MERASKIPWQELGFRLVGSAGNGLDALQLVEEQEPDLLLTDIRMPFISGIELARQVREVRPATHIAFLTECDDFEYAKQAIRYNIISYMLKPLTVSGLAEELRVIRQKIDDDFAMFRQAPPSGSGLDTRTALLMPLVLDPCADGEEEARMRSYRAVHHLHHHRGLLHRQVQDAPLHLHHGQYAGHLRYDYLCHQGRVLRRH